MRVRSSMRRRDFARETELRQQKMATTAASSPAAVPTSRRGVQKGGYARMRTSSAVRGTSVKPRICGKARFGCQASASMRQIPATDSLLPRGIADRSFRVAWTQTGTMRPSQSRLMFGKSSVGTKRAMPHSRTACP